MNYNRTIEHAMYCFLSTRFLTLPVISTILQDGGQP
jgi:hypothetical protein